MAKVKSRAKSASAKPQGKKLTKKGVGPKSKKVGLEKMEAMAKKGGKSC